MKTVIKTYKVYSFDELSPEAQESAIEYRRNGREYHWDEDNKNSLKAFESILPVTITDWSYGGRGEQVCFDFDETDEIKELSGNRLRTYILNNYENDLFKGKYYSTPGHYDENKKYHYKFRHSKCQKEHCAVLTGYCIDDEILSPIYKFIEKPDNTTFYELMEECFSSWISACSSDYEYNYSDECIKEELENDECEYDEDGNEL